VTADNGSFDSGVLNPGDSYTVAFDGQETVTHHCTMHPEMRGSVAVGGGGGNAPADQPAIESMPSESMEAEESY
jgi:hypothetical protein